jgi:DnaJ-class molecular chaperone
MYEKILVTCEDCLGRGIVESETDEGPYSRAIIVRCEECEGAGEYHKYVEVPYEEEQD